MTPDPLLITLRCGGPGWQRCEEMRKLHFPAHRNVVPAHIMMFHSLPGDQMAEIEAQAKELVAAAPAFPPRVTGVRSLGRGVALTVDSPELLKLHRGMSAIWDQWLIPQDRARFSPHVTIQNKVTGDEARILLASLKTTFEPFSVEALGVDVWHYRNGPWEHTTFLAFPTAI